MPTEFLNDLADPRVAIYQSLTDAAVLREQDCFIAEGRLVVRRLLEARRFDIRSLLVNRAAFDSLHAEVATLDGRIPIFVCETSAFETLTGHHIHRGCLALVQRPEPLEFNALLQTIEARRAIAAPAADSDVSSSRRQVIVALEAVTNPDNMGGVFRNAAAFEAAAVVLGPGCCDPLYRKAIRTSMAATLQVSYATVDDWLRTFDLLRARGFTIAALSPRPPAVDVDSFALAAPRHVALLVGTEGNGLTAALEAAADVRVRIPISTAVDSLNLAVAVGVALQRLCSISQ